MLQIPHLGVRTFSELLPILERLEEADLAHQLNQDDTKAFAPILSLILRGTQMMNFLLLAKPGNHGGIAPTPKFKGYRRGCAPVPAPDFRYRRNCFHVTSVITHNR